MNGDEQKVTFRLPALAGKKMWVINGGYGAHEMPVIRKQSVEVEGALAHAAALRHRSAHGARGAAA